MQIRDGSSHYKDMNDFQKYLTLVDYPADKEKIYDVVKRQGVNANIIKFVQLLPKLTFHTPRQVLDSLGLS